MRCKVGDMAWITKSIITSNLMKIVTVTEYIGKFERNDTFMYRGTAYPVPESDHYWWIHSSSPMTTALGETSKAYIADSWLRPFPPDELNNDPIDETLKLGSDVLTDA